MGKKMRSFIIPSALALVLGVQGPAFGEEANTDETGVGGASSETLEISPPPPEDTAQAPAADQASDTAQTASGSGSDSGKDKLLSEAELEQLVAPIALYSDPLLANVLVASTYPLEVVQAERWYEKNKKLKGTALQDALKKEDWDSSIKDLVGVPDALEMMNKDLSWTQKLGDAVLAQQADVMNAVQALRALAKKNGKLESSPQQTVTVTQTVVQNGDAASSESATSSGGQQTEDVIVIEPTNPDEIYVPYYQPTVVYGTWPYPTYQPYYFPPPPGYVVGGALARGLAWSAGFAIGNAIWGHGVNWGRNDINVNVNRNISGNTINRNNVNAQKWEHNSTHRRGVEYNNTNVQNKFSNRQNTRNNAGNNAGKNAGDRRNNAGGQRPGGGNNRPSVGDIESGLKKPGGSDGGARGGNLAGNKGGGNSGGKRPSAGNIESQLKKSGGGERRGNAGSKAGANKPAANRPSANKPAANRPSANKPAANRSGARKPQNRPSGGNAFQKRDGGGARNAASRGRESFGGRSMSRGRGGGGRRGGGGGRRR